MHTCKSDRFYLIIASDMDTVATSNPLSSPFPF